MFTQPKPRARFREALLALSLAAACAGPLAPGGPDGAGLAPDSGSAIDAGPDTGSAPDAGDAGPAADAGDAGTGDADAGKTADAGPAQIEHVVILLQENHSFDSYFGLYCAGPTGTPFPSPCSGRFCCEQAPQFVPGRDDGTSAARTCTAWEEPGSYLDDAYNNSGDPSHLANNEYQEMHYTGATGSIDGAFLMDRYPCHNVKYARYQDPALPAVYPEIPASDASYPLRTYHSLAASGALADRYFQPIAGASTSNDVFLSRASFVFQDNQRGLPFAGYADQTLGDLLDAQGVSWAVYLGGLAAGCASGQGYPDCVDLTDDPFTFSARYQTDSTVLRDLGTFATDLANGALPAVSLLRAVGTLSEHPESGSGGDITAGENGFIKATLDALNATPAAAKTLVLISWDESGGFYDHVPPPLALADGCALPTTPVWSGNLPPQGRNACALIDSSRLTDGSRVPQQTSAPEYFSNANYMAGQEYYGARVALLALGPFARAGSVSHVVLEHSSIVAFLEWNFLGHQSGQLGARDLHVNNLGSLLDPALGVPEGIAPAAAPDGGSPQPGCEWGGAPGTCLSATSCGAAADRTSEPGTACPTGSGCCIDTPRVADNPPLPAGHKLMAQAQVTPEMTSWAVAILHDHARFPIYSTTTRLFGALAVLARVEWHPPDFQNGAVHRGVTLYVPQ